MTIAARPANLHWNYFLALEQDLERVSRYIEFCEPNFSVYSIELAHLLFAAASEVDVVAQLLCEQLAPAGPRGNMDQYRAVFQRTLPGLASIEVFVPRFGLSFRPWLNFAQDQNPAWWRSYNKVKHERDAKFSQATLANALNALGALLILSCQHYSRKFAPQPGGALEMKDTTQLLQPESALVRLDESQYYRRLLV